jgi:beta-carotene hydroxylase
LASDLLHVTPRQRWLTVALPFACVAAYVAFAGLGWWPPAVLAVAAYTFYSYGSTSHDLVHGNLRLPRRLNRVLLSLVELLGLRSGHAYQAAHLHHHASFPHDDDVEARAAQGSWRAALLAGPLHQPRVWWWAVRHARHDRGWMMLEGIACVALAVGAVAAWPVTPIPLIYVVLVVLGSWTFPLITAYLPHNAGGADALAQTWRFRGTVAAVVFRQHLYHLEHHLYPRVPHHHWPTLAERLDPYLDRAGVKPVYFGF